MSILNSELQLFESTVISDEATNGGVMSHKVIDSGVVQNVFPNVTVAERASGSTKYRKLFLKVSNADNFTLLNPQFWIDSPTAADDWAVMFAATQTDVQSDITGAEQIYGCATLNTDVAAGGSTIIVDVEDASLVGMFVDGGTGRITNKDTPDSVTGTEETFVISGAPTVSGTTVTMTSASVLANSYATADITRVMPVYEPGDIAASSDAWAETTTAGTYDEAAYPVVLDNIGTVEQTVTLTFTDATNFTATSDNPAVTLGSGTTGVDFIPNNADFSKPYLKLEAAGFGGTWAAGETIVFKTHPAAVPIWERRDVPAGAASLSNNSILLAISGESA